MDEVLIALPSSDQAALLKTGIKFLHLIGLVVGSGAATVLDLVILRFITVGKIAPEHASMIEFCSRLVTAGPPRSLDLRRSLPAPLLCV